MKDKKSRERALIEEFRTACTDFPNGRIVDSESPDFLVKAGDGVVGIDIVEYQRGQGGKGGSPHRAGEEFRKDVVRRAQEKFEGKCGVPLVVMTLWNVSDGDKKRGNPDVLAAAIADAVASRMPIAPYETKKVDSGDLDGTALVEWLDSIAIDYFPSQREGTWASRDYGFVSGDIAELERLIAAKEALLPRYRARCDLAWLVIVATGEGIASSVEFGELPSLCSSFSRVYFFNRLVQRATLMNPDDTTN